MEPHGDRNDSPLLPSATVLMVRDGPPGLECFLLKRHSLSDVLGDAYVFPGGKVDREDAALVDCLDMEPDALRAALGEEDLTAAQAAALHVAALREVFEETQVLYADVRAAQAREAWHAMREGRGFDELVRALGVRLQASRIAPWTRWITPVVGGVIRKRFDARFFVATVPSGQEPVHDGREAVASVWVPPRTALEQYWRGEIDLAPPQIMTLAHVARLPDVAAVLAEARSRRPPTILPQSFGTLAERTVCYPGDPQHPVAERAMPGPTRLHYRNRRFEPDAGFEALFG
jgi:8-oxo-dGTP pyrophosphatase MutT (NUDIX family)